MRRVLEPELMDDPEQARAYASADFADVNQGFVDRFRSLFPEFTRGRAVDLGCGPADISIRLVRAVSFLDVVAVDAARPMLALARSRVAVRLVCALVAELPFPARSFDAIVSNSLLHHLPEPRPFWDEVLRVAKPGAVVLVVDLARPASAERAREIVERYAGSEPEILKRDFYNSLCAALTPEELRASLPPRLRRFECQSVSDRHVAVWGRIA